MDALELKSLIHKILSDQDFRDWLKFHEAHFFACHHF